MKRILFAAVVFLASISSAPVYAAPVFPQVKIDRVDMTDFPRLRVFATFLDRQLRPVAVDRLLEVEVLSRRGRERPESMLLFQKGVAADSEEATMLARAKAGRPMGLVVVVAGTAMSPLGLPAIDASLRKAVAAVFDGLVETDQANVLWYGDHIHTYIPTAGKTGELSNLSDRYAECQASLDALPVEDAAAPTVGGTIEELGPEACGLVTGHGELAAIIEKMQNFGGYHPALFGVRFMLPDVTPEHPLQEVPGARSVRPLPAFAEALRMLVRQGEGLEQRTLVVISDGRDGYLLAEEDAKLRFQRRDCVAALPGKATRKLEKERSACVQQKLHQFLGAEQKRYAEQAAKWLALARASGIRVHAVAYESDVADRAFELERLEILSVESGGTFRRATGPGSLYEEVTNLTEELNAQIVIDFTSALVQGEELSLRLRAKVDGGNAFVSEDHPIVTPVFDESFMALVNGRLIWLQNAVGYTWYVVILVILGILGAFLFFKMGKKALGGLLKKASKSAGKVGA